MRFNNWLSVSSFFDEINDHARKRAMNLHTVFGHRRDEVKNWKTSALYELAGDKNADVRPQILREFPNGMKILDMRQRIAEIRTPANTDTSNPTDGSTNSSAPENTTQQTEPSPNLPDTSWDDLLRCVNSDTDLLTAAKADMLHPQFMVAKGLEQSRELIIRNMGGLNRKDRKQAMRAVYAVLEHYQATFNAELKANLSYANKALQAQLKDQVAEQKALTKQAQALLKSRFDKSDFRKIRSVLHTDKQPTDSQRAEAFDLLLKLEPLFS